MDIGEKIIIKTDFSEVVGARYIREGEYSGELFLRDFLKPKFVKVLNENKLLFIDLDGVYGYPPSFISESFGKLSIEFGSEKVIRHIKFKSDEVGFRLEKIISEIKNPTHENCEKI